MAPFDDWDFGAGELLTPEEELSDAIEEGNYPRAYAILRRLDRPLEGEAAADCLIRCFRRTEKLFRAVLEQLSPEVRTGAVSYNFGGNSMRLEGSLLVLAAAMGSGRHVEALLARGFDPNAAGPDSARPRRHGGFLRGLGPACRRCAAPGNILFLRSGDGFHAVVNGCTPLAAAYAAGNLPTVDVLRRTPGVWTTESSAVCRAAALYAESRSLVHGWLFPLDPEEAPSAFGAGPAPKPHTVLRSILPGGENLQPGAFADFCSPALLAELYRSGTCTDDDARAVLSALETAAIHDRPGRPPFAGGTTVVPEELTAKLLLTAKHFPKVCREPEQCAVFLRAWLGLEPEDPGRAALLKTWKALAGADRDLSPAADVLFQLRGERLRDCLEALAEGGRLSVAADAVRPDSQAQLREILRRVRIVPSPFRGGVSAFAKGVMELSPDLRLQKKLFGDGPLAFESREALLRCAGVRSRPLILTTQFQAPTETYDLSRIRAGFRHHADPAAGERRERTAAMLDGDMDADACLEYLLDPGTLEHCVTFSAALSAGASGVLVYSRLPEKLCAAENPNALRAWLRLDPDFPYGVFRAELRDAGGFDWLNGPPLALAAAAGRTENVRTLLDAGTDPDVCCCAMLSAPAQTLACTPLLLAVWFGREETARELLSAGAACDLGRGCGYRLFRRMPAEGRALAERLETVGYERALAREKEDGTWTD